MTAAAMKRKALDHFRSSRVVDTGAGSALRSLSSSIWNAMGEKPTPGHRPDAT